VLEGKGKRCGLSDVGSDLLSFPPLVNCVVNEEKTGSNYLCPIIEVLQNVLIIK
jgi:hypothetical protein